MWAFVSVRHFYDSIKDPAAHRRRNAVRPPEYARARGWRAGDGVILVRARLFVSSHWPTPGGIAEMGL